MLSNNQIREVDLLRYGFTTLLISILALPSAFSSVLSFTIDNDSAFGTDHNYTNGFQITYADTVNSQDKAHSESDKIWSISLGQKIWTPSYLGNSTPVPEQRPYAGFLYAIWERATISPSKSHSFSLLTGITGPNSQAENAQRKVHQILLLERPSGWDYQLEEEIIVNLTYEGSALLYKSDKLKHKQHEFSIPVRLMMGNYRSEIATGMMWRRGSSLQHSFSSAKTENEMIFRPQLVQGNNTGSFLFAGGETRYRFNDITIDGDTPEGVYPVDIQPIQATLVFGGVTYSDKGGGSIAIAAKSRDFKQDNHPISANISLSLFWIY